MNTLILSQQNNSLDRPLSIGEVANQVAAKHSFTDYQSRKAENTLRRQANDLALFADYLQSVGHNVSGNLALDSEAWQGITWGLVEAFVKAQLQKGYSVSSANVRLSTIKTYAKLAVKAGTLDKSEYAMIRTVSGYSHKESKRIDKAREDIELPVRLGSKKAEAVSISRDTALTLTDNFLHGDNGQGRRDRLIMCLLLNHGLRVSELVLLRVEDFNLAENTFTFYRPKVDKVGTHRLTNGTLEAARAYIQNDAPKSGLLLRNSRKDGRLHEQGMTDRAVNKRVKALGEKLGIENLSPHDCRHYAATFHAKTKDVKELMDIFGWNSPAMAVRYIEDSRVIDLE